MKQTKKEKLEVMNKEIIQDLDWRITPFIENGRQMFFLNKIYKGKFVGKITCNKKELKNLKRFMAERKFK